MYLKNALALAPRMSSPAGTQSHAKSTESRAVSRPPLWLHAGFWACIAISVAVVMRRLETLAFPSRATAPRLAGLDAAFASHAALTLAHILPALGFVVVAPFVLLRPSRAGWAERLLFPLGVVVGITAYAMSAFAVGGWVERSAVLCFNTWFLYSLWRAWWLGRRGQAARKRAWMLRAVVVLLGIATTRPVMGVLFATGALTHLEPKQFFGLAFWIGFSVNALAVEIWLRHRGRNPQIGEPAAS